jgi:transcriptional regulator with XRE-family HTH domain
MNFNKELIAWREKQKLTVEQASEKLHLSIRAYTDRENNRADLNVPEKVGLLVGLGMSYEKALTIAEQANVFTFGDPEMVRSMEERWENPFVKETDTGFILICRDHDTYDYEIPKSNLKDAEDILGWLDHITEKTWITREHINHFITLSTSYLKLHIH